VFYALGLLGAAVLDAATPEGIADWLIELILVWVASAFGSATELVTIAAVGSIVVLAGMWTSPSTAAPFWMDAVNRLAAILIIWAMTHVAVRRQSAEEERRRAAREIKVLEGLLPICSGCKSIRTESGDWRRLESYLSEHSEVKLTHTLCPGCAQKFFQDES
jgi:hypothetical protein